MDCCRTSLRLGADDVKVMARKPRGFFKASEWELEDAEEENVEIVVNHAPKSFVIENGKLTGMLFDKMEYDLDAKGRITAERIVGEQFFPCDDVILAIGQENAFPWIENDLGIEFDKWHVPKVDKVTFQSTRPEVFFGGDAAFGPKNIIWAVEHGHQAAISIHKFCQGLSRERAPAAAAQSVEPQDGHPRVVVQERLQPGRAAADAARRSEGALQEGQHRSRARLHRRAGRRRSAALPELRRADRVRGEAVHRVRCLHRHLPGRLPDDDRQRLRRRAAPAPEGAGAQRDPAAVRFRAAETDRARHGQRRGRLRALRPVRRALPDGGVGHAEIDDPNPLRERRDHLHAPRSRLARPPKRLRHQARERQRHRLGEREHAADEVHLPDGHSGDGQELLSRRTSRACRPGTRSA